MLEKYKISEISGTCIPLYGNDIDTDRIIPARFLRCVTFSQLGEQVFHDERFDKNNQPVDHPFNKAAYRGGSILLVNGNFGCGSSREHAPQSLLRFGIRAIVGESFAEIFKENCVKTGLVTATLDSKILVGIMESVSQNSAIQAKLDVAQKLFLINNSSFKVGIPESSRQAYLNGTWNSTAFLLANKNGIERVAENLNSIYGR